MARDAEATKQRIFEAARSEFAARGAAGGRIDRIASAASANKQLIYAYFGSKQALFDAVVSETVTRFLDEVPFDAENLPEFAVAAYDFFMDQPDILRLGAWHTLEPEAREREIPVIEKAVAHQMKAIKRAQEAGIVAKTFGAQELLAMVTGIARAWAVAAPEIAHLTGDNARIRARQRAAVREAVRRLVEP
jgi:AcrR family transcriptional regulator